MPGSDEFIALMRRRAERPESTAGFFGIRPESDRFTFVVDLSGSMRQNFGTTERSRYVEAIDQMVRFLHAAPKGTQFNVYLFNSGVYQLSRKSIEVDAKSLAEVRSSLLEFNPQGGTGLRPAIEAALHIGEDGLPDFESFEADTVVVLCDGATNEGMGWVEGVLDRVLPEVPVIFHCVLLGHKGDGALRQLAELSGGRLVRVGA